jgi:hypothetical protein
VVSGLWFPSWARTELHQAAERGVVAVIARFVGRPDAISGQVGARLMPMYCAAENGKAEAVKALALLGVSLQRPNNSGATPLFAAAEKDTVQWRACSPEGQRGQHVILGRH